MCVLLVALIISVMVVLTLYRRNRELTTDVDSALIKVLHLEDALTISKEVSAEKDKELAKARLRIEELKKVLEAYEHYEL